MKADIEQAIDFGRAGRLEDAAAICREIIGNQPDNAQALHLLGMIADRRGDTETALSLLDRAISCEPAAILYHRGRGGILQRQGRFADAVAAYDQALGIEPDNIEAHLARGSALHQQGRLEDALLAYDRALQVKPDLASAHLNRGVILEQGSRLDEALESFDRALRIKPDYVRAHVNRGVVLGGQGHFDRAVEAYDSALEIDSDCIDAHVNRGVALVALSRFEQALKAFDQAARLKPDVADIQFNRGNALAALGQFRHALAAYDQALRLEPNHVQSHYNRGGALEREARFEDALAAYDRALQIQPDWTAVHINRGNVLRKLGRPKKALAAYDRALRIQPDLPKAHCNRGNALADQGRFADAIGAYRRALHLEPDYAAAHSNLLFYLNYDPAQDDHALFAAHRDWGERYAHHPQAYATYSNSRDPDKTLNVGVVSADLGRHPVGYFFYRLLDAADPAKAQWICYSGRLRREDDLTDQLKARAHGWRSTLGRSDIELANTIRADGIDILIDLGGHTAGNRLDCFALRPAPVQVHWAGYCHSIPLVDYSVWDPIQVPVGEERWFVEKVVRLPDARWCYAPPEYAAEVSDPPVLKRGYITFGSFNNLSKVNSGVISLWARIMKEVSDSRLLLNWRTLVDPCERQRFSMYFVAHGIAANRIELRQGESGHASVLAEYADVDIALDPFPFSGCTTTCEALWMGLPVVTLPRTRPVSRQTQAFLTALGRTEWVAKEVNDYIHIAKDLASNPDRLARLRRDQRSLMAVSPVCDGPRFARHFEVALRGMWRNWCIPEQT